MTLPPGWQVRQLGDVASTALGKMLDRGKRRGLPQVPYLRNVNVQWDRIDTADVLMMELADDERSRFAVEPGDLLVCEGGEIGRAAIWQGSWEYIAYQKALHRVRPSDAVLPRYLVHLFRHLALSGHLAAHATGTTILHLPQQQLRRLPIPVPPVDEQQRIVDILEDHLSRLDAGAQGLRSAQTWADRLRLSTIAEGIEAAGGTETTLGEIAISVRNGIFVSRAGREPDGVPILRIGAVRPLALDLADLRYSAKSVSTLEADGWLLNDGDLLFTRYNGNPRFVGACAVVPDGVGPLTWPDKLIRVSVDRHRAEPMFVAMSCSIGRARARIDALTKTTSGQSGISGRDLRGVPLLLPALEAQRRAVARATDLFGTLDRLATAIAAASARHIRLRRALLQAAFSGQLIGRKSDLERAEEAASVGR